MAPVAELSAVLASIDLSAISGFDVVEVVKARSRQLAHDRAMLMAAVVEPGRRFDGDDGRDPFPEEFAADEIRAALVLTRRAAETLYWTGRDLIERLPEVHAAFAAGLIDPARAEVSSSRPSPKRSWVNNVMPRMPVRLWGTGDDSPGSPCIWPARSRRSTPATRF